MVHAEVPPIEIAAPPERVREVVRYALTILGFLILTMFQLLDFAKMPEWHEGHFKSIVVPSGKNPKDLVVGDKLEVALTHGLNFSPVIKVRSPYCILVTASLT